MTIRQFWRELSGENFAIKRKLENEKRVGVSFPPKYKIIVELILC
jgi:hypothetical protein